MTERSSGGVIHDIGYRHYDGARVDQRRIAAHLYLTGLRHAFGLGRSGRSKTLPILLCVLGLAPAVVMVALSAVLDYNKPFVAYANYTNQTMMLVSLFVAAQAPVLFSRDLRSRTIVLFLARPLPSSVFALVRWASLATACFLFIVVPTTLLFLGALLSDADVSDQLGKYLASLPLALLLSALLAAVCGAIASVALRRGLAIMGSILALVVLNTIVLNVQYSGNDEAGQVAGLFSPWAQVNGLADAANAGITVEAPPEGAMVLVYLLVVAVELALLLLFLVRRFAKAGR